MSPESPAARRRLRGLERLYSLELEQARVEWAALDRALREQSLRLAQLQQDIERTHQAESGWVTRSQGASPAMLRQIRTYKLWQYKLQAEQQQKIEQTQKALDAAHASVVTRFERVRVIQRLRARRAQEAFAYRLRAELKRLDDQAILLTNYRKQEHSMPVDAIGLPASSSTTSAATPAISETDFLQILLTQLQFQDPLKPVDDEQFVAQLAQFSNLEISEEQNASVQSLLTMGDAGQALSLLGKSVQVGADQGNAVGTVTAVTFASDGQPTLTLDSSGTGVATTSVSLSDITLVNDTSATE